MAKCGCAGSGSGGVGVADTPSVDLTLLNNIITAAVKLDPNPDNLLQILAGGLSLSCADVAGCGGGAANVGVADSPGIDFTTSGSGTEADPRLISGDTIARFFQTSAITFSRTLTGAAGVYEEVTELPGLTLTVPGTYIVAMEAVGNATNTQAGAGVQVNTSVSAQIRKNGVALPNTETRLILNTQGQATTTEPALQVHATGAATRVVTSNGTDVLTIWANRSSDAGTTSQIISNANGRTRLTAWRIGA